MLYQIPETVQHNEHIKMLIDFSEKKNDDGKHGEETSRNLAGGI